MVMGACLLEKRADILAGAEPGGKRAKRGKRATPDGLNSLQHD